MVEIQDFKVGDTVRVYTKYKEVVGEEKKDTRGVKEATKEEIKERIAQFEGVVISKKSKNFTVRRESYGIGIERIFPFDMPNLVKVEVVKSELKTKRRAKLYYLRKKK